MKPILSHFWEYQNKPFFFSNGQVREFYLKVLNEEERQRLCKNIAEHLKDAQLFIQKRAVSALFGVYSRFSINLVTLS